LPTMRATASSALSRMVMGFLRGTILGLDIGVSVQFFCRETNEAPGRDDRTEGKA
jgi:hypothetical protein